MTTTVLLLNLGILAFVLRTGLGTRELNRRRFRLPLAVVALVAALYLRSIPTSAAARPHQGAGPSSRAQIDRREVVGAR